MALGAVGVASGMTPTGDWAPAARTFRNCTALNKVYKHGVGRPNARDHTSGTRVTTFKRSRPLYRANKSMDGDGDGIACEKL
jgi:hypothetical protein